MTSEALSRRSVLRGLAVTSGAGVAGYVIARNSGAARSIGRTSAANGYGAAVSTGGRFLARLDQVPQRGGLILAGDKIVLTRATSGAVLGLSAVCTHQGCTVSAVTDESIVCPCHGSQFDPRTGAVIAGPAPRPLPTITVVTRDGGVYTT